MRTLYIEGPATHDDPESCVGGRKGAGEALIGVHAGQAMEPRNNHSGVPTLSHQAEGNTVSGATREPLADSTRSETLRMCGVSMRENREIPCPPVG